MRRVRDRAGHERIWYDASEIEKIAADVLQAAGLWPDLQRPVVDIERLLEVHLGAVVDYAGDLDRQTLGYTVFESPPRVVVNRRLTDLSTDPNATLGLRGRWRATLAHEAAHILLHADLYAAGEASAKQQSRDLTPRLGAHAAGHDWREVQANMGMAALLMPREPFMAMVRQRLAETLVFPPLDPASGIAQDLVRWLGESFEVSRQATQLRLVARGVIAP